MTDLTTLKMKTRKLKRNHYKQTLRKPKDGGRRGSEEKPGGQLGNNCSYSG